MTAQIETLLKTNHATRARSFVKTLTWRTLGSLDTFALGWLVTGSYVFAGSIASAEIITKMVLYFVHERAWAHVNWGTR